MQGDSAGLAVELEAAHRRADLAVAILSRVVETLDFADEEHDGPTTAEVDTDVIRASIVDCGDDLDSFVLHSTVALMMRSLRREP